jgi:hypothetical protein
MKVGEISLSENRSYTAAVIGYRIYKEGITGHTVKIDERDGRTYEGWSPK